MALTPKIETNTASKKSSIKTKPLDAVRSTVPVGEVIKEELVRVNINVSPDTRSRWKKAAIDQGISLQDMLIAAVEAHLENSNEHIFK